MKDMLTITTTRTTESIATGTTTSRTSPRSVPLATILSIGSNRAPLLVCHCILIYGVLLFLVHRFDRHRAFTTPIGDSSVFQNSRTRPCRSLHFSWTRRVLCSCCPLALLGSSTFSGSSQTLILKTMRGIILRRRIRRLKCQSSFPHMNGKK